MKKNIIAIGSTLLCFTGINLQSFAQNEGTNDPVKRNTIFVEFSGQSESPSLNIDRLFRVDKKVKASLRTGLIFNPFYISDDHLKVGIPITYNFIFGQKNHHLELGLGLTALYNNQKNITIYDKTINEFGVVKYNTLYGSQKYFSFSLQPKIGYRYQKPTGGFFFQASISPTLCSFNKAGNLKANNLIYAPASENFRFLKKNDFLLQMIGLGFGYTFK